MPNQYHNFRCLSTGELNALRHKGGGIFLYRGKAWTEQELSQYFNLFRDSSAERVPTYPEPLRWANPGKYTGTLVSNKFRHNRGRVR